MTFAATGSFVSSANVSTLSITPSAVGRFFLIAVNNGSNATVTASSIASSNATWTPLTASFAGSTNAQTVRIFIGVATSTSTATLTVTWSGTAPAGINIAGHEFSTTAGTSNVFLDVSGHIDGAGTNTWASLTPGHGAGELYFGWCGDSGTAGSITTTGYISSQDSNGNGIGANAACTSAAQAPVWTDSGMVFGQMALLFEASTAVASPAPLVVPPGLQSPAVLAEPPRFSIPPPPLQQPAPAPQPVPPGLQSPMALAEPARFSIPQPGPPVLPWPSLPPTPPGLQSPAVLAEPPRFSQPAPPQQQPAPAPQPIPPGLQSPMSLGVPTTPATAAPPAPPPAAVPGSVPPNPPGLQSPMVLAVPSRFAIPPAPQQQPAPAPQPVPPGLQSPMSLTVPARPATAAPPVVVPPAVASPAPLLTPPGLQSPMSLTVPARPATSTPCIKLANNAEEGSAGTPVTPVNSGGAPNNAFDVVATGTGATLTYDNTQAADGALSFLVTTPGVATNSYASWTTQLGPPQTQVWFRLYLYFTAPPPSSFRLWTGVNGTTNCASLQVTSTGRLQWFDAPHAAILISTLPIPLGTWFWVEGFLVGSPTAGQVELKLYNSVSSIVPAEIDTSPATQNTFGQITGARYGVSGSTANISFWMDDIGASTCGYLGPAFTVTTPPGAVLSAQGGAGGDRDHEIRVFRSIMPGEVPASGSALPKLQGRGYAAPPPERAEDLEHLWEAPAEPAKPPGPTPAEIVLGEAHKAAGALYDLGRILAPEPYVAPSKAACGALRKIGTETLRCKRKRGHGGMHSDRGVRWG